MFRPADRGRGEGESCGDGGVQRVDLAFLRNGGDVVRHVENELRDARILPADDEQEFLNLLRAKVFQRRFAAAVQRHDRVAFLLRDFAILVGGAVDRDLEVFTGSGGGFDDGRKKERHAAARQEDVVPSENFRAAHDGAFVVRVFDGIQKNHAGQADHVREGRVRKRFGIQHNSLMLTGLA